MEVWSPDTGVFDWEEEHGCLDCGERMRRVVNKKSEKSPDFFCATCKKGLWLQNKPKPKPRPQTVPQGDQTAYFIRIAKSLEALLGVVRIIESKMTKDKLKDYRPPEQPPETLNPDGSIDDPWPPSPDEPIPPLTDDDK